MAEKSLQRLSQRRRRRHPPWIRISRRIFFRTVLSSSSESFWRLGLTMGSAARSSTELALHARRSSGRQTRLHHRHSSSQAPLGQSAQAQNGGAVVISPVVSRKKGKETGLVLGFTVDLAVIYEPSQKGEASSSSQQQQNQTPRTITVPIESQKHQGENEKEEKLQFRESDFQWRWRRIEPRDVHSRATNASYGGATGKRVGAGQSAYRDSEDTRRGQDGGDK